MASDPSRTQVLVTGGSGFVGSFCIIALLNAGYRVRTTIRSLSKSPTVTEALIQNGGISKTTVTERLEFVVADLGKDEGWDAAVAGCTFILHVASPFPPSVPKHEDDLIIPAREGTLRILRASKAAGVKRVVITSSFAAVGYGHPPQSTPFTEDTWTNINGPGVLPYTKSKTLAERAAWAYVNSPEGKGLELCTVQPTWIFGPVLSADFSPSILLVQCLLNGELPGCPDLTLGVIDVRDLASLQLLAMTRPEVVGERFLAVSPPSITVKQVAMILKERLPNASKRVPTMQLPNFLLRILARFDQEIASVAPALGKRLDCTNEKAKRILGWEPISKEDAIVATAESLIKLGLVKK